jgi:hypothetical protein
VHMGDHCLSFNHIESKDLFVAMVFIYSGFAGSLGRAWPPWVGDLARPTMHSAWTCALWALLLMVWH